MSLSSVGSSPSLSSSTSARLRHVLVVGGSGFVGSAICRSALRHGLAVTSLSQSGCSPYESSGSGSGGRGEQHQEWTRSVRWCKGDLLSSDDQWRQRVFTPAAAPTPTTSTAGGSTSTSSVPGSAAAVPPVDAVVSCVGGFGSVGWMRRVNGDANIAVFEAVSAYQQVRRVGFISAFHYQLPQLLQRGYMEGKLAAEASLAALFPSSQAGDAASSGGGSSSSGGMSRAAVVSQTGVLYGSRYLRSLGVHLPLQVFGAPLGLLTDNSLVRSIRQTPLLGPLLTPLLLPPVSVDALSDVMIERLMDASLAPGVHTVTVDEIRQAQHTKSS